MVVMAIVAIIAAAGGAVSYQAASKQARDSRRTADLESVRAVAEVYRADCGVYPTTLPWGSQLVGPTQLPCKNNVYMQKLPADPKPEYTYKYVYGANSYYLCSTYEVLPSPVPQLTITQICGSTACNLSATPAVNCRYFVTNP